MDDGALIILRRHGNPKGQRLVLSHGNGLSADLYYPFWSLLTDTFDIVINDVRGHGWNPVSDLRVHNFLRFANDNVTIFQAIDRHFGRKPKIGVFHSMSALIALLQEQQDSIFSALLLCEPPADADSITVANTLIQAIPSVAGIADLVEREELLDLGYRLSHALIGNRPMERSLQRPQYGNG